jgi:APA family basic amino acid/polyamine antiporter
MRLSIFARKSLEAIQAEASDEGGSFSRSLNGWNILLLGIGGIIGAGIFVLTGQASAQYAGPAIVISFILSGIACTFAALCYAELAAMIPVAGSAYTYTYATLGQLIAWIIGWDLILEYLFGASAVAVGWSGYVVSFLKDFGVEVPRALSSAPFNFVHGHNGEPGQWIQTGAIINVPAMLIVGVCTALLYVGIKESAKFNNMIVVVKLSVLALFVVFGALHILPQNWVPFIPENTGTFGHFGWSGIFRGAGVIFFAYIGFDSVSALAQETKNPQRDMPIGIIGSLIACTVVYIVVALVLTGIVKYDLLNVPDPIAVAVDTVGDSLRWLRPFIKLGAVAGLSSVVLVLLMAQPRILFSMARDGLLPAASARIHPRFKTPYISTVITGVLAALVAGLFPIGVLGELVSIGTLLAFVLVCLGVLVLRYVEPTAHRPFKAPFVGVVSVLGALSALLQMAALPVDTWIRLGAWMTLGLLVYFTYGIRNARVR